VHHARRPELVQLLIDFVRFLAFCLRPKTSLAGENLFLRKQLAFYQERKVKPGVPTNRRA